MLKVMFNKGYPMGQCVKLSLSIWRGLTVVETTPETAEDQGVQIVDPCKIHHNVFFAGRMTSTRRGVSASWASSWRKPGDTAEAATDAAEAATDAAEAATDAAEAAEAKAATDEYDALYANKAANSNKARFSNPAPVVVIGRAPFNPKIEGLFQNWSWAPAKTRAAQRAALVLQFPSAAEKYVCQQGSGVPNWWGTFDPMAFDSYSSEEAELEAEAIAEGESDPGFYSPGQDEDNVWWDGYRISTSLGRFHVQHLRRPIAGHLRQMLHQLSIETLPLPVMAQGHLALWDENYLLDYTPGLPGLQGNFFNHLFPALVLPSPPWAIVRGPGYVLSPNHPPIKLLDRAYLAHHPVPVGKVD